MGNVVPFLASSGMMHLCSGDALVMHIIDDVNLVMLDWPDVAVRVLHRLAETSFRAALLPPKRSESLPLGQVEGKSLRFIGWDWDFESDTISPCAKKLRSVMVDAYKLLNDPSTPSEQVERGLGRMIWLALGLRPLLAILMAGVDRLNHS